MTDSEYKKLDPKSRSSMYAGNAIAIAVYAAIVLTALHFLWDWILENITANETMIWIFVAAISVPIAVYLTAGPRVFYNHYRYKINDETIDVMRGIIIIRRTMVPIERVHQVEVTRGPINNMFGLANVDVTTAGGIARIEYLALAEAEEIAKRLNALINSIVKGLRDADE